MEQRQEGNPLRINYVTSDGYAFEYSRFMQSQGQECLYYTDFRNHPMLSVGWFASTMTDFDASRVRYLSLTESSPIGLDATCRDILGKIEDCDVIHSLGLHAYWALLAGRPLVYQVFGGDLTRWPFLDSTPEDRGRSYLIREILNKAAIIWGGHHQKDTHRALEALGIPASKVRPFRIPIDAKVFTPLGGGEVALERRRHGAGDEFVILLASQLKMNPNAALNYTKGTDIFIRAVAEFSKAVGEGKVKFWIVDKGPEREEAHALVRDMGLEDKVVWLTPRNRSMLPALFNAADVVLDQMWPECGTHGSLALEAMACGKPVFLHLDTDFRRNIAKEPSLPNVQVTCLRDVIEQLLELYHNPEKRVEIGCASRQCILSEYDVPVACAHMLQMYREAMERPKGTDR